MWGRQKNLNVLKNLIEPVLSIFHKYSLIVLMIALSLSGAAQSSDSTMVLKDTVYYGQSYLTPDSTEVTHRDFSESKLKELKSDPDFNYAEPPTVAESLWDRLWMWIGYILDMLIRGATTTQLGKLIMYAIGLALLIAAIMMILKVDAVKVFFSGADQGASNYQVFHENIHEMDFEKLIKEAVGKNELRQGTRLVFLYALKILSDKQHIAWVPGKTNHEYVEELKQGELKTGFNELSFYFDYAWYGNFQITPDLFEKVEHAFHQLKSRAN